MIIFKDPMVELPERACWVYILFDTGYKTWTIPAYYEAKDNTFINVGVWSEESENSGLLFIDRGITIIPLRYIRGWIPAGEINR